LILSYGKRDHELFSYYTKSVIIGNPVFDDWFNNSLDVEQIKDIKSRINQRKKTILYLPTHSDLSSIDLFFKELVRLKDSYNIIVKPYYLTLREELEKIKLLEKNNFIVYRDSFGLLLLLKIFDMVISDNLMRRWMKSLKNLRLKNRFQEINFLPTT
jgi:CDP-glycerol glycerophosphotransferase (TagB/SpsB family)